MPCTSLSPSSLTGRGSAKCTAQSKDQALPNLAHTLWAHGLLLPTYAQLSWAEQTCCTPARIQSTLLTPATLASALLGRKDQCLLTWKPHPLEKGFAFSSALKRGEAGPHLGLEVRPQRVAVTTTRIGCWQTRILLNSCRFTLIPWLRVFQPNWLMALL